MGHRAPTASEALPEGLGGPGQALWLQHVHQATLQDGAGPLLLPHGGFQIPVWTAHV